MRRSIVTAAAVAGIGIIGIGGAAFAATQLGQDAPSGDSESASDGAPDHDSPHGWDLPGSHTLPGDLADHLPDGMDPEEAIDAVGPVLDAAFEGLVLLDLTPQELLTELRAGSTLGELAAEQGVDPDELVQLGIQPLEGLLDDAVAGGHVTQDEADTAGTELEQWLRAVVTEGHEAAGLLGLPGADG